MIIHTPAHIITHTHTLIHTLTYTPTLTPTPAHTCIHTHPHTCPCLHPPPPPTHTHTGSTQTQIGDCYNDPNFSCDSANRVEGGVTSPATTCCGLGRLAYTTNSVVGCQICTRKFSIHVSSLLSLVHNLM